MYINYANYAFSGVTIWISVWWCTMVRESEGGAYVQGLFFFLISDNSKPQKTFLPMMSDH